MPKILKLLIGFGALALVGFVWLFVFGIQAFLRNEAGRESHHMPGLKLVPVALDNTLVSPASGNYGECSGYLIQLPWPEKQLPSTTPPSRVQLPVAMNALQLPGLLRFGALGVFFCLFSQAT